jgi:hypothetical protein
MFQKHKILSIVSFQLCSFYMQLVVETIGLTNKLKYVSMDKTWPQKSISLDKINFDG